MTLKYKHVYVKHILHNGCRFYHNNYNLSNIIIMMQMFTEFLSW